MLCILRHLIAKMAQSWAAYGNLNPANHISSDLSPPENPREQLFMRIVHWYDLVKDDKCCAFPPGLQGSWSTTPGIPRRLIQTKCPGDRVTLHSNRVLSCQAASLQKSWQSVKGHGWKEDTCDYSFCDTIYAASKSNEEGAQWNLRKGSKGDGSTITPFAHSQSRECRIIYLRKQTEGIYPGVRWKQHGAFPEKWID